MFHRHFPELKVSATLIYRTYKKLGICYKYIQKKKKFIDFTDPIYLDIFRKMHRQLGLARLYELKIVYLDEAIFSHNTFNKRAWSGTYHPISVPENTLKVKTQAIIAAISEDVGLEAYALHPRSIKAEQFIAFLEQLSERFNGQDFAVFMDNL
jgi:hypothetical protein